jgi:PBSX family phage terminase large subunit
MSNQININLFKTQSDCWKYLTDNVTTDITFGGGVSGGKTWLGCLWVTTMCLNYPETRYLIGRTVLQTLKLTTLKTYLNLLKTINLKADEHYVYNQQSNVITFYNKSEVILKDLQYNPSDSQFDSLGSLEITGAFLDESQQLTRLAYSVVKSRIRYKLNEYNLIPKILLTCNPGTNFLKTDFYDPWIKDELPENKKFVQSLITDNPHVSKDYLQNLKSLPTIQQKRLLQGSWTFNEDEDNVFDYDTITSSIYRKSPNPNDTKYMSVDVARFGSDKTVICIWVGLCLTEIKIFEKLDTVQVSNEIKDLIKTYGIHPNNIIVDSDGVGSGVADQIRGKNFMNNSKPLHDQNFANLKTQSYIKLSDLFKSGELSININNPDLLDKMTQELLTIKYKKLDQDTRIQITSKDDIKKLLGRSPDISDAMAMRMYYEIKSLKTTGKYSISFL